MKKIALYTILSLLIASPAFALASPDGDPGGSTGSNVGETDCTTQPECANLGYTTDATCDEGAFIYCPYDTSYKKCIPNAVTSAEIDCAELGFTTENKADWCDKIVKCPTDSSYTLCAKNITCAEGEALIGSDCKTIYSSCSAAGLLSFAECNTAGYTCGALRTIYTSADGTTMACYLGKTAKSCPAGYTTGAASSCSKTPDGGTCSDGYMLLFSTEYYAGDSACKACTCKPELDLKPSTGCNCTSAKPYYVNGVCRADCPGHAQGLECFMCAINQEYVDPSLGSHSGGSND
jgi:hypothetical protein